MGWRIRQARLLKKCGPPVLPEAPYYDPKAENIQKLDSTQVYADTTCGCRLFLRLEEHLIVGPVE
jgi:hypothetical protein